MDETRDKLKQYQYEVIIVGGGPAGIATALTLNVLGVSNCIVEASTLPKHKYGEALPPNAKPILRQLDILSLVEDDHHIKYYGNKSCWGTDRLEQKEFISDIHGHGYLLDRGYFEKQLWKFYKTNEGILYSGSKLRKITRGDQSLSLTIDNKSHKINLQCRYVVDATGRKASVCRQLGFNKINQDSQFALSLAIPSDKVFEHQIIIEATANGWWYAAPNGKSEIILMFFTLKNLIPSGIKIGAFLKDELKSSIHISQIASASIFSKSNIKIMPAGTSRLEKSHGDHWIAVGDAAFAYDPISSYGITSALASGYYAGQALASKLAGRQEAMDAYRYIVENAFQIYNEKLINHYGLEQRWINSEYWKNRFLNF